MSRSRDERAPVLYLAPWVDYGGSDKNTIDWFRWIDRERFAPSLITTQPSPNRLLSEVAPFAEEVWPLPELMPAEDMPRFIFDFLHSRKIQVLHLMNSRLGFELLPDLACLPNPPATVVQLHVEEADRSGYVRYVTTRYGNLVDRFSASNEHVARAIEGYGIPAERIRVIYTGADPDEEFSPERAEPIEELPRDRLQILFAARLVAQKDPLLMLDVASALRDRGASFQIHVVGEGDLEEEIRRRIVTEDLSEHVLLHPPTPGLQRWYAACDVLLMTSVFEGIPCVVFETMAMGLPIVAPDLPAIGELLGEAEDTLISPRDSVEAYASALAHLAEDRDHLKVQGARMRARARAQFTVQQMAEGHGELYDELIAAAKPRSEDGEEKASAERPEPIRFSDRPRNGEPLVSVLVPHFNQTRFLRECIESIRAQTYPEIEIVVVDDASTQAAAGAALSELETEGDVTVVRLEENRGPSHARNVGLERCSGRYILPVDADNLLLPDAIANLVAQLSAAGETVGFIYPNLRYFGNREDYYEVPEYNLYTLLHGNFCDTCSLLDRKIFDLGERYMEELRLGHEDWEFVLRLAFRGVRGEAARGPTILYRKWGFNRSDIVDHQPNRFEEVLAEISPFRGMKAEIKAQESPALSIVALQAPSARSTDDALTAAVSAQTCSDFELIEESELREAISQARGSYLVLTSSTGSALLEDPAFCEKVLRRFVATDNDIDAIVLIDADSDGRFPLRALGAEEGLQDAVPHTVIWRRTVELELPRGLLADPGNPPASIARLLSGAGLRVEWRHAPGTAGGQLKGAWVELPTNPASVDDPHNLRPGAKPLLPGAGEYDVPRWKDTPTWVPALTTIAMRYRENYGARRLIVHGPTPSGFTLEHHLGALRSTSLEGTARLVRIGDDYRLIPRGEWDATPEDAEDIGYVEQAGFPQMDPLALAVHRETGQRIVVAATGDDPLLAEVDLVEGIGFAEPFPARPRQLPPADLRGYGLVALTRAVDRLRRRHCHAIGDMPEGELLVELGGLAESELGGDIGAWIVDGYLVTERHRPPAQRPRLLGAARWVTEPAAWGDLASPLSRAKVSARRAAIAAGCLARRPRSLADPIGDPLGWLFGSERPGRAPLFAAYHPVTGDQLLTRAPEGAAQLSYGPPVLLGFIRCIAPLTGDLHPRPLAIPWARRFGAVPLRG